MPAVDYGQPDPPQREEPIAPRGESIAEDHRFLYANGDRPLPGFTIKRGIGRGGFGEVYYAVSDAGKEVALKLLCHHLDVELRGIQHCLNLKHPHLLMIYDVQRDSRGNTWVIMEYIRGVSLDQMIAKHLTGLSPHEALLWFHGMAAGVAYLHSHGIVHRDLKPGNIFLEEGVVKVGDYGLAKYISCSRRSGQTQSVGTVHYMAPEVGRGRYGKEIDIYAMGIILYEMLTGRVPFDGESAGEILIKHLTEEPDLSIVPQAFRRVIARALEKDPERRYHTVAEMLADLPPSPQPAAVSAGHVWETTQQRQGPDQAGAREDPSPVTTGPHDGKLFTPERPLGTTRTLRIRKGNTASIGKAVSDQLRGLAERSRILLPLLVISFVLGLAFAPRATISLAAVAMVTLAGIWVVRNILLPLVGWRSSEAVVNAELVKPDVAPAGVRSADVPHSEPAILIATPAVPLTREEAFIKKWKSTPFRGHLAELLGSMLAAVLIACVVASAFYLVLTFRGQAPNILQAAWVYFMTTLGSWIVLVLTKLWEAREGDVVLRRFIMMIAGSVIGATGFLLAHFLRADLPFDPRWVTWHDWQPPVAFYRDGQPMLPAMVASFGTLFLLVRWWHMSHPLRARRFWVWGLVGPTIAALFTSALWVFPAQWLIIPAVGMAITLQLAAPWFAGSRFYGQRLTQPIKGANP